MPFLAAPFPLPATSVSTKTRLPVNGGVSGHGVSLRGGYEEHAGLDRLAQQGVKRSEITAPAVRAADAQANNDYEAGGGHEGEPTEASRQTVAGDIAAPSPIGIALPTSKHTTASHPCVPSRLCLGPRTRGSRFRSDRPSACPPPCSSANRAPPARSAERLA